MKIQRNEGLVYALINRDVRIKENIGWMTCFGIFRSLSHFLKGYLYQDLVLFLNLLQRVWFHTTFHRFRQKN